MHSVLQPLTTTKKMTQIPRVPPFHLQNLHAITIFLPRDYKRGVTNQPTQIQKKPLSKLRLYRKWPSLLTTLHHQPPTPPQPFQPQLQLQLQLFHTLPQPQPLLFQPRPTLPQSPPQLQLQSPQPHTLLQLSPVLTHQRPTCTLVLPPLLSPLPPVSWLFSSVRFWIVVFLEFPFCIPLQYRYR
ncbi:hypothetical protein BCR33DRAFT_857695 [Rhizoclosmatium globosum]|uniref:Uncharacterized protein n=1 Tax=Rhizoclosmatium globosum TaxID=329046 RepID=A0A1Y2B5P6_9FUNG|nr:hypothetical protein BCR33DRAFT_857695 [Rhizoclosmatium globosum]|eukprot:ORY29425.1 hypothetical protein BCR33DRAFT_857695 [Rhizoclosmatium globosum]